MQYQSSEAVRRATGRNWKEWFALLDKSGARSKLHKQIAAWLNSEGLLRGWWCQAVVTTYEQAIGRREVGQTCDGKWNAGASRILPGSLDDGLKLWRHAVAGARRFNGVPLASEPRVTASKKFRYWRVRLRDGSEVAVGFYRSPSGKVSLGLSHTQLASKHAVATWKEYWKKRIRSLQAPAPAIAAGGQHVPRAVARKKVDRSGRVIS